MMRGSGVDSCVVGVVLVKPQVLTLELDMDWTASKLVMHITNKHRVFELIDAQWISSPLPRFEAWNASHANEKLEPSTGALQRH